MYTYTYIIIISIELIYRKIYENSTTIYTLYNIYCVLQNISFT